MRGNAHVLRVTKRHYAAFADLKDASVDEFAVCCTLLLRGTSRVPIPPPPLPPWIVRVAGLLFSLFVELKGNFSWCFWYVIPDFSVVMTRIFQVVLTKIFETLSSQMDQIRWAEMRWAKSHQHKGKAWFYLVAEMASPTMRAINHNICVERCAEWQAPAKATRKEQSSPIHAYHGLLCWKLNWIEKVWLNSLRCFHKYRNELLHIINMEKHSYNNLPMLQL